MPVAHRKLDTFEFVQQRAGLGTEIAAGAELQGFRIRKAGSDDQFTSGPEMCMSTGTFCVMARARARRGGEPMSLAHIVHVQRQVTTDQ